MAAGKRRLSAPRAPQDGLPGVLHTVLGSYVLLWTGTVVAALLAWPFAGALRGVYGLRPAAPVAPGGVGVAFAIFANNAREAAIPFLLALARRRGRRVRAAGDAILAGCLAGNVALGGLALGAYGPRLLWRLAHWPFEWAALAVALAVWRRARTGEHDPGELWRLAGACVVLLGVAALLESYGLPGGA